MALAELDPKGMRRFWKRHRKNTKRARKMENAVRRNLYLDPAAKLVGGIATIMAAIASLFRRH